MLRIVACLLGLLSSVKKASPFSCLDKQCQCKFQAWDPAASPSLPDVQKGIWMQQHRKCQWQGYGAGAKLPAVGWAGGHLLGPIVAILFRAAKHLCAHQKRPSAPKFTYAASLPG